MVALGGGDAIRAVDGIQWAAATRPGGSKPNQDRYLVTPTPSGLLAAVIDGATTVSNAHPNGSDYAHALMTALQDLAPGAPLTPVELLRRAIERARDHLRLPGATAPSAALALVHLTPDAVELAVLGDCSAVIGLSHEPGPVVITDNRIKRIAPDLRTTYRDRLARGSGFDDDHRELLTRIREAELRHRNAPHGYPIAADDPSAADQAITRTWPRERLQWLALASDGAAAGPEKYATHPSWTAAAVDQPAKVITAAHAAEEADPDAHRWPRSKRHDDKTLIVLRRNGHPQPN